MNDNKKAVESMKYGVNVVTSRFEDKLNGLTVAWVSQASMKPIMVSIAIHKPWYSHELLSKSEYFAIHVLADDQIDIGKHFGYKSGRDSNKLESIDWSPKYKGVPVIEGCKAVLGCRKIKQVSAGDHTIFIGVVEYSEVDENKKAQIYDPKIYFP
jgi:flavin reductase (DIM6/NTAB) family NADH-FMN oxidoreductase RutF